MARNVKRKEKSEREMDWHPSTEPYTEDAPFNPMHPRPGTPPEVIEDFWGPDDEKHIRRIERMFRTA